MTPTQTASPGPPTHTTGTVRRDGDSVRLLRDIEALARHCKDDLSPLPWNTYFDKLIQRVDRPHSLRE